MGWAGAIGTLLSLILWWLNGSKERARGKIDAAIKVWEGKLAEALGRGDSDGITLASERLSELRKERRRLSA